MKKYYLAFGVSLAMLAVGIYTQLMDSTVQIIVRNLGYSETVKGSILAVMNGLPLIFIPYFGKLSDNCKSVYGRRTPFIVIGGISSAVLLIIAIIFAMFNSIIGYGVFIILSYLALMINKPAGQAILPDLIEPDFRSTANAIANAVMGFGGAILILLIGVFGKEVFWIYVISGLVMIGSIFIFKFVIDEPKLIQNSNFATINIQNKSDEIKIFHNEYISKLKKSTKIGLLLVLFCIFFANFGFGALSTSIQNYSVMVWSMTDNQAALLNVVLGVGGFLGIISTPYISNRVGNRFTMLFALIFMLVGFCLIVPIKSYSTLIFASFGLIGYGWTCFNIVAFPAVINFSDIKNNGIFTSYYTLAITLPKAITVLSSSILMDKLGYNSLFLYVVSSLGFATILIIASKFYFKTRI